MNGEGCKTKSLKGSFLVLPVGKTFFAQVPKQFALGNAFVVTLTSCCVKIMTKVGKQNWSHRSFIQYT